MYLYRVDLHLTRGEHSLAQTWVIYKEQSQAKHLQEHETVCKR